VRFHDHIEKQLGVGHPLAPIRGFANKAAEHAARLAAIVTLVDDLDADTIPLAGIEAGMALTEFYLTETLRLGETAAEDADLVLAETTRVWLQQFERVHLAQVYQSGPNALRDAKTARRILSIVEDHGWISRIEGGAELGGNHRREAWRVSQ